MEAKIQRDLLLRITNAFIKFKKAPKERITIAYLETRLETLEKLWDKFNNNHECIIGNIVEEELQQSSYNLDSDYDKAEEKYIEYKAELKSYLSELESKAKMKGDSKSHSHMSTKLLSITVPTFSGNDHELPTFRDSLVLLLHCNEPLDDVQKLHYLKGYLTGIARNSHHESFLHQSMQQVDVISSPATTPISLLVQSLVKQLCSLLEKDVSRANQLYNTICEKLHSMNLIDDSYAMGEFEVMRSQYQRALYQLVTVATGSEIPITLPATWPIVQPTGLEWSRYHKEFEELFLIASGGFGSVFKARHRLDGVEYAVKKVFIKSSDVNSVMTHLSEVKTIASLNHPNIVNYKAAWLEPMIESTLKKKKKSKYHMDTDSDDFSISSNRVSSVYPNIMKSFKTYNSKELTKNQSHSDFEISFKNSSSFDNFDKTVSSEESESDCEEETTTPDDHNAVCKLLNSNEFENCSRINLKWATLYIQMTFCQQTLKQWLDERNYHMILSRKGSDDLTLHHSDSNDSTCLENSFLPDVFPVAGTNIDVVVDMFTQLVRGLHYIHSKGVIHHDVKPSNVFVGRNENGLVVQLGDFGLACPLQQSHSGLALGTHLYAAPEQLEGQCNPKSDMYSLGIILLEMVEPFSTDMERVKTITDLRKGQIPAHLTANYPKIAHIIGKLVQRRPSRRLDTNQLLEELNHLSENKDDTIRSLREELAAKDDEIAKLKLMLAKLNFRS